MQIEEIRREYHRKVCERIIRIKVSKKGKEFPNFADVGNPFSIKVAQGIVNRIGFPVQKISVDHPEVEEMPGQAAGGRFEQITKEFIEASFTLLAHLRPGRWIYTTGTSISAFEQYEHLAEISRIIENNPDLAAALRGDYIIMPDVIVARYPVDDAEINELSSVINRESDIAKYTPFRKANSPTNFPFLHASISCKWTLRSDRAQNARTEALNLIRNRKGRLPHVVAVTGEPLLSRLASLALGTGDLDCVYHFALHELRLTLVDLKDKNGLDFLDMMVNGKRLRDISDLPFDLAV